MAKSIGSLVSINKANRTVTVGLPQPIQTVDMTTADTEVEFTLPAAAFNYMFKLREGSGGTSPAMLVSLEPGGTSDATKYMNIPQSTPFVDDKTLLDLETTFYFKCATGGQTLEVVYNLISE